MPDRRPWPTLKASQAALSIEASRAKALARVSGMEARAFLIGLRTAMRACADLEQDTYELADRASGEARAEGLARAAGIASAQRRIGELFDAALAGAGQAAPPRRGLQELIRKILEMKAP